MDISHLFFLITSFVLGLRHGIDWDHIAAITDVSGSQDSSGKSFIQGMLYALGHGLVIVILGILSVIFGVQLPDWVDSVMEPVVGLTLIVLGIWLLSSVFLRGKRFKLVSRWMLLYKGVRTLGDFIHHKFSRHGSDGHAHVEYTNLPSRSAFIVGMLHGIGAETPTQLLLFLSAAGIGGATSGILMILTFVLGLLISNMLLVLLVIFGFSRVEKNEYLTIGLGSLSGAFSLIVGIIFLTGQSGFLPSILGG